MCVYKKNDSNHKMRDDDDGVCVPVFGYCVNFIYKEYHKTVNGGARASSAIIIIIIVMMFAPCDERLSRSKSTDTHGHRHKTQASPLVGKNAYWWRGSIAIAHEINKRLHTLTGWMGEGLLMLFQWTLASYSSSVALGNT